MNISSLLQRLQTYFVGDNERSPRSDQAEQHAAAIVVYLEDGEWASLRQQLFPPLRYFLPETVLQSGWKTIIAAVGPLRQAGNPVVRVGWFFTSVRVPVQFSRAKLAVSFWMTPSWKLVTLQLAPHPSLPWKAPSYAISSEAQDISLTLGRGLRRVHATLTLPSWQVVGDSKVPCLVLIGGSGPVDRDSSVGALKPFKDFALGLADRGVAVCRFDKLASTLLGKLTIRKKTVTLTDEYVYHVLDAVRQVRRNPGVDADRVVLLGHSLGTLIAARLVSIDPSLAGCILMAAPAEPLYRCAIRQLEYLDSLDSGPDANSSSSSSDRPEGENSQVTALRQQADLADSSSLDLSTPASKLPFGIGPAYWLEYRTFDPLETLEHVRKPVLVLQGDRDYQTTAKEDYSKFHEKFHGRANFTFYLYESLNHLFVHGKGKPAPLEYENPGNVALEVIHDIERWIKNPS